MGVNRAGLAIVDDGAVRSAAVQEIIRRYFRSACEYAMGFAEKETVDRVRLLVEELKARPEDRTVVGPARSAAADGEKRGKGSEGSFCGAAMELPDGTIVTGRNSSLMHASSALILNAVKVRAGIPDSEHLLSPHVLESISHFKRDVLQGRVLSLDLEETLIALCISATANNSAQRAVEVLKDLRGCEVHLTHIPSPGDEAGLRKLGVNLTADPDFATRRLFVA
jgi:uncharacterized protein (UPF0371 family)